MDQAGVQQIFFQHIKSSLASHLSLVDEVADLLKISNDSAYRRIRGEKPLSFEEIKVLCAQYRISLDQLFHLSNDSFLFSGPLTNNSNFGIESHLEHVVAQANYFNSFEHRELFYFGKDLYHFHWLIFPELAVFKIFFWMKNILQCPFEGKYITEVESIRESITRIMSKMNEAFSKLPVTEIWHDDTMNATIRQIDYCRQCKIFPSDEYAVGLYKNLLDMIDHIEKQTEAGCKFAYGGKPTAASVPFKFYYNEFILGDNCAMAVINNTKVVYINHSVMNILMTRDLVFTEYINQYLQNIMHRSTLMSHVGEKERSKFFNHLREKVERRIKDI